MDLEKAMIIAAQGMRAQGTRMRVISENLANAGTTGKRPGEAPYQRQMVSFKNMMDRAQGFKGVRVDKILQDDAPFDLKFDPGHPAADEKGYVRYPNVNPMVEIMDMREAQRSYEASLGIIEMTKSMLSRTIDLLRN